MRLIDADAIEYTYTTVRGTEDGHNWRVFAVGQDEIDDMPTIDAVPVVRCRECKYYMNSNEQCELLDTRLQFYSAKKRWTEESFCSWGERQDGAEDG